MASMGAEVEGWETLPAETREQYKVQSKLFETSELSELIRQLGETEFVMKRSAQPQLMLENHLISMCRRSPLIQGATQPSSGASFDQEALHSLDMLEDRIGKIEDFLKRLSQRKNKAAEKSGKTQATAKKMEDVPVEDKSIAGKPVEDHQVEETQEAYEAIPGKSVEKAAETPKEGCGIGTATPLNLEGVKKLWPHVLEQMRQDKKVSIQAMAKEAELAGMEGCELTLSFPPDKAILRERLNRQDIKEYLATLIQQKTGRRLKLILVQAEERSEPGEEQESTSAKLKQYMPEELIVEEE